jgi:hypothetical protein
VRHPVGREAHDIERPHQIHVDDATKLFERQHAVPADDPPRRPDAGAVDDDADRAARLGGVEGRAHLVFVSDVGGGENDLISEFARQVRAEGGR